MQTDSEKGFPLNATGMTGPNHTTSRQAGNNNFRPGNGNGSPRSMSNADQRVIDSSMTGQMQTTATHRPAAQQSQQTGVTAQRRPANSLTDVRPRHCWVCGATNHVASACSQRHDRLSSTGTQLRTTTSSTPSTAELQRKPARVYTASTNPPNHMNVANTDIAHSNNQSQ